MAKAASKVPHRALYSRMSYLYQAATYLATRELPQNSLGEGRCKSPASCNSSQGNHSEALESSPNTLLQPASRLLISDLRAVSHKATLRMSPDVKNSICKNCDTVLLVGSTCTNTIENTSRGAKKAWADVLVRKCNICGLAKRFPLAERQKRRHHRLLPQNTQIPATKQPGDQAGV